MQKNKRGESSLELLLLVVNTAFFYQIEKMMKL